MKKLDYDKFLNANKLIGVFCKNRQEIEEFEKQMNIDIRYNIKANTPDKLSRFYYNGVVFLNDGRFGTLQDWETEIDIYDFTTGKVIDWKRGTKRPNDYCYHKDVVDYKDYVFENQLYRVIYSKTYNHHYSKYAEYPSYQIEGYIDNFNPGDKIAIRDKNNLLYCIDYKLITLIEPIKKNEK